MGQERKEKTAEIIGEPRRFEMITKDESQRSRFVDLIIEKEISLIFGFYIKYSFNNFNAVTPDKNAYFTSLAACT